MTDKISDRLRESHCLIPVDFARSAIRVNWGGGFSVGERIRVEVHCSAYSKPTGREGVAKELQKVKEEE